MKTLKKLLLTVFALAAFIPAAAQNTITATLLDGQTGEPVGFATVSLTKKGTQKPYKYVLSGENGSFKFDNVAAGQYSIKAELMGYKPFSREIQYAGKKMELGEIAMELDQQQIDAASVSALGNSILIKKDTIEYNATAFKTTENDVLEDLLKKLPGVEVSDDGGITVNGETITKITIDGKTFFLDDPQLATKNIPARIINKLKVIEKKSEQAEFTGIDDGEEEHVIDLSVKPGMMKGAFGSIQGGGGLDLPNGGEVEREARYQGAGFLGKFTDKQQLSVLLNGNNTNNRGFNDLAGSMMGGMRGGGGGMGRSNGSGGRGNNGVTISYMGGANGAWDLCDDRMQLGSNYLFGFTDRRVEEESMKRTFLNDHETNIYNTTGFDNTISRGHRFGVRLDHKFSENTSILFEPRVNFGGGSYSELSSSHTDKDTDGSITNLNTSDVNNTGWNRNVSTSGYLLFRQRLGIPGRTLTVMGRYSFSNNDLNGNNYSLTRDLVEGRDSTVNQSFTSNSKSMSAMGRATYTEPLGNNFYLEANYAFNWSKNNSDKQTENLITGEHAYEFSNSVENTMTYHTIGANLMYQKEKSRFQIGAAIMPTKTVNNTSRYDYEKRQYVTLDPYEYNILRWSPRAMVWWEMGENANARLFYRGTSSQPSISKLMPVPDNTNPLNVNFGNPYLKPYFSHSIRGDVRYNNKRKFSSFSIRFNASYDQDPIVNTVWYGNNGGQFAMPFNGPASASAGLNTFLNLPVGHSNFIISNMANINWSNRSSYVGTGIDMTTYDTEGYYAFMEEFVRNFNDPTYFKKHIATNTTNSLSILERLRLTYRLDNLELQASGLTRINRSWYTISQKASNTLTFNNQVRASVNWTWEAIGATLKTEFNYNWYNGYTGVGYTPEFLLDAEIQKSLFKKKVTLSLKGYDILGQSKNLNVSDDSNYHMETRNNTLGRYVILSLTYRFGTFDPSKMGGGHGHGPGRR